MSDVNLAALVPSFLPQGEFSEVRLDGVLGRLFVERPGLQPPTKHHERHTYHHRRADYRQQRGHEHKRHPS
jgi:hypothetical protein